MGNTYLKKLYSIIRPINCKFWMKCEKIEYRLLDLLNFGIKYVRIFASENRWNVRTLNLKMSKNEIFKILKK